MLELDRSDRRGGTEGPQLLAPRAPVTTKPFLLGAFLAPVLAIHLCAGHAVAACSFEDRISFPCQIGREWLIWPVQRCPQRRRSQQRFVGR